MYTSTKLHCHIPQHCMHIPNTLSHPTTLHIPNYTVTSHNTVHIYQATQCHIPQHCTHLPNYTVSHPTTLYTSTKLHSVKSHNTLNIYKTTLSHPTTLYTSTKLHSVISHNTVHIYQTTQCHIPQHCKHLPIYTVSHPTTLYKSI